MYICHIVGCDGCGKSTILAQLHDNYPATYIKEPMDRSIITEPNIFKKVRLFANDRKLIYDQLKGVTGPIISDRSFICSVVYQSLEFNESPPISSIHYVYKCNQDIPMPTQVVYLTTNPDVIVKRISNRSDEDVPSVTWIKSIQERYQLVFKLLDIEPLVIDTSHSNISDNVSRIISILP